MIKLINLLKEVRIIKNIEYPIVLDLFKKINRTKFTNPDFEKEFASTKIIPKLLKDLNKNELNVLYDKLIRLQKKYNIN